MHNSFENCKTQAIVRCVEGTADHVNRKNGYELVYISLGVKKTRQENRVVSERFPPTLLPEGNPALRDPERKGALAGFSRAECPGVPAESEFA